MYGATVKIRDVQVGNMREALEVKRRAAAGEDFGDLAEKFSEDPRMRGLRGNGRRSAATRRGSATFLRSRRLR